ncbi:division/cell wall cluster transcriptional repressor MraZ [Cryobacterium sp. TMT2-17-1]|uniref:division/cell wall cluster transcriptional repressor MraZ n=1 Tax=unclassified Cryobacterium TaxID=2649013 RepID=UPI00106A8C23|nr:MULTISPECIES: division/cell wall cluster transcriptional repressor MraZ [unclassified Cryobacterium]TFC38928.1 division/cell wall cluster transcriptional repressor MraZ [Cryobacterium sp. TMT2-14]TFC54309.1 division/cell wall cluster transcriptional repressor MraZ [Cryobacterium sp. TMT2-17-1]
MFFGTYAPKLDEKGRIILPAKFRDELSPGIVMTRGQENCLYVFTTREFEAYYAKISQAPLTDQSGRSFSRMMFSGASAEQPDKQNRVTIPANLRAWAGLDRDLSVIGAGNRVEIWDTAAWDAYLSEQEEPFANITEEVIPGLI